MSGWREPEGGDRERAKRTFVVGGGLGLLVVAWLMLSRPGEEGLPSQGFDARGLSRLGAQRGLLSGLVAKALAHPAALGLLLNNKTLVDAYFSRDLVKRNCESGAALKSYLTNASDPNGVSEEVALARQLLQSPAAASAAAGTEFGRRLTSCPSVGELAKDPGTVLQVASANPALLGLVSDANAVSALSSNPQALSLLGGAQSALGGGASRAP